MSCFTSSFSPHWLNVLATSYQTISKGGCCNGWWDFLFIDKKNSVLMTSFLFLMQIFFSIEMLVSESKTAQQEEIKKSTRLLSTRTTAKSHLVKGRARPPFELNRRRGKERFRSERSHQTPKRDLCTQQEGYGQRRTRCSRVAKERERGGGGIPLTWLKQAMPFLFSIKTKRLYCSYTK